MKYLAIKTVLAGVPLLSPPIELHASRFLLSHSFEHLLRRLRLHIIIQSIYDLRRIYEIIVTFAFE